MGAPRETDALKDNAKASSDEEAEKSEPPKETLGEKIIDALKNITVEPTLLIFMTAGMLNLTTSLNLSLDKACRVSLNYSDHICDALKAHTIESQHEKEVQILVAKGLAWKTYITASIPSVIGMFVGSWSDKTGYRKIFMIIPICGQILLCISNVIQIYFFYDFTFEFLILSEAIIEGFIGSWCICFITIYSYLAAVTSTESRTFRMAIASFCMTGGTRIGIASSGAVYSAFGFYGDYAFAGSLQVINLLYVVFKVKDPERTAANKMHDNRGLGHFFHTFFDMTNVKDSLAVVFKKDTNNRRIWLIILLLLVTCIFGTVFGETSLLFLLTRYKFNWNEVKYSWFQLYYFIILTFGTIFSITVLSKHLKWHDSLLGIISTFSDIASSFVYCFAPDAIFFFVGPVVEILSGFTQPALRSTVSKLVAQNELGRVTSIFVLMENISPLIYVPLYTRAYSATLDVLPGAIFLLSIAVTLPPFLVFTWLYAEYRIKLKKKNLASHDVSLPLT